MKKWHRFLERFWQNDNTNRGIVCGLIVTQIIAYLLHVFQMMIPTVMIDWVLDDYTIQKLLTWAAASAGIYLSVQVMDGLFGGYLYYKYEIWLTQKKQEQMLARVMEKKVYEVEKYSEGYLMNLVFQDTGNIVSVSVQMLIRIPATCISILMTLLILWHFAPLLCMVQLFIIPLYIGATFLFQKRMEEAQTEQYVRRDTLHSTILNILNHKKAVKLARADGFFQNKIVQYYSDFLCFTLKYWRIFFCAEQLPTLVVQIGNLIMLICGIFLYMEGRLSLGMLVWVGTIGSLISEELKDLCTRFLRRMANGVSYDRVDEFDAATTTKAIGQYETDAQTISLEEIGIQIGGKFLYHIPEFATENTGIILLEGANGSGKSTLLNWMLEVAPPDIVQTGADSKIRFPERLFEKTSYLSSPDILFNGTVLDNILLGETKTAKTDEIMEMLGIDFTEKQVSTRPVNLSFGEQQKVFLARVLNRSSDYFILDEPTTNLDLATKQRLADYLRRLAEEKVIILIGHEKELQTIADKIYRIEERELIRVL
mgnify:FL=1|jgi:ABC-type bacteriocin/lantibiotic exporter with double-glycine peptidase domain